MASHPLSLLKFAQEVSISGLVLVTISILLVTLSFGATVAFFRLGVEWRGKERGSCTVLSMSCAVLITQVRPEHKYTISPWEMIHLPVGDNALCAPTYTVYPAVCNKSLTATYQC
jgi:hypothetical protein